MNPVWEIHWKLDVPSKVKIFIWKALRGTVPGYAILAARHIPVSPQCPVCKSGAENIKHLLFTCDRAHKVWKSLGISDIINQATAADLSGSVVLEELLRHSPKASPVLGQIGLKEVIATATWYIWWQRREFVKGQQVASLVRTAFAIQAFLSNLSSRRANKEEVTTWTKPP